tara:strand:- start:166 stop:315 length:150 start_codon:yes stop_codon:yes gene_type:complete
MVAIRFLAPVFLVVEHELIMLRAIIAVVKMRFLFMEVNVLMASFYGRMQ